ncbi:MAG: peptide chain release factor N(5)-glutamine methyltransferase [Candidatus Zixiibacteriota bacterium]
MSTTLLEALNSGVKFLKERGIGNPRSSAEILLCSILDLSRVDLYLNKDQVLNEKDKRKLDEFLEERASGKPLQYITGSTEFLDLEFKVDPRVMIPRPETEILTLSVIDHFKKIKKENQPLKIIDLGTGSGVIAITLAVNLKESLIYATDISEDALKLASDNATKHKVEERIEFNSGDLLQPLENKNIQNSVDCIVSNPPYVKDDDSESLSKEITDFEPRVALFSGDDGLNFNRRIVKECHKYLKRDGLLALEVGWEDGDRLDDFIQSGGLFHEIETIKDLAGIKRIVTALKI